MVVASGRPQIELRGLKRSGKVCGAVLSLNGSDSAELKRACALAGTRARAHAHPVALAATGRAGQASPRRALELLFGRQSPTPMTCSLTRCPRPCWR